MHSVATDVTCSMVCVSVCLWGSWVWCAKTAEWLNQLFGEHMLAQGKLYQMGSRSPWGHVRGKHAVAYCNVPSYDCLYCSTTAMHIYHSQCVLLFWHWSVFHCIYDLSLLILYYVLKLNRQLFRWYLLYIACWICTIFVNYFELLYDATIYCLHESWPWQWQIFYQWRIFYQKHRFLPSIL